MAFNQQICFEGMIYNKQIHDIQTIILKYLEVLALPRSKAQMLVILLLLKVILVTE